MFSSVTEEDSDDSVCMSGRKSHHFRVSSSSESEDSIVASCSRRKTCRVPSSLSESDDSTFGSPVRKKCRVLPASDSDSSGTSDSDIEMNLRRSSNDRRPKRRTISSDLEESLDNGLDKLEKSQVDACSSDSDDGERCIICFKTLKPPFAHPSNCTHKFHPVCLSTWSKTSNTCPIDRVKYTSIHKVTLQGELISQERVTTPPPQDHNADFEPDQATFCEVCSQHDREHEMLLCDRCEAGYHLNCLTPPLLEVPEGSWFCPLCTDLGNELAEEVSDLMDDAAVILESRMRRTTFQPRIPRGPRTRGAQRVFDIIHRQASLNEPSTSSVMVQRRQTSRRTRKSKSRQKPRSTRYKVELITVEDGTTLEVKVAVNTRTKARRYSKKGSKKKCSKGSRKSANIQRPSNPSTTAGGDGPSRSLDLFGNRPQLDYFSGCEAEDELDEDGGGGGGGLAFMHRASRTNIRNMASRKQIAAQIFNARPRRTIPKIEVSRAPVDLVSSIIEEQEKWHSPTTSYQSASNGDIKAIIKDTKGVKVRQSAGGSTAGAASSNASPSAYRQVNRDGGTGGTRSGGGSSESNFHPLQPPPEPPSKLYEDDDFDLYADIEPPNPSKLAPPPEPPALLFAMDGEDKEDVGAASSPEDAGLVIDDRHDTYDPEMPTSPPSPPSPPRSKPPVENSKKLDASVSAASCFVALEDIPPPPTPPDDDSPSECPNQGIYSKMSMEIAKGKSDMNISDVEADMSTESPRDDDVPSNALRECKVSDNKENEEKKEETLSKDVHEVIRDKYEEGELAETIKTVNNGIEDETSIAPSVVEKNENEGDEDGELDGDDQSDSDETPKAAPSATSSNKTEHPEEAFHSETNKVMSDSEEKDLRGGEVVHMHGSEDGSYIAEATHKFSSTKGVDKDTEQEGEILELGCEEERDGLVDITDEEMSNYERSWELEDNTKEKKSAGLDGLETEAISDCEYPPAETDVPEPEANNVEEPVENESSVKIVENGSREEEGEILTEERVPVQWKKLSKGTKDRSYRGDKEAKNKEKKKEILKKKEKRKELERYDVRKLISEKPRRKVDEFGRDISSNSRSPSRSLSRGRKSPSDHHRSLSRGKKRRSKSRSRSKERLKERARSRERGRDRSREKSWDRSKEKGGKDRSKERKSPGRNKKKEPRKERVKTRKERGRSREKGSRDRKKRKKSPSMSCSSCSCSSCEREKRRSKKLTVIVPNEEAVDDARDKNKGKYKKRGRSPKRQRRRSPVPSKEVFTSGDNILVSVNFKSSAGEPGRRKDAVSSKRKKDDEPRRKKDKGSKENQTVRSIVTAKNSNKRKLNTRNLKPVAIIDLDASPFRETLTSPKEVIILTDSDSDDKIPQVENNMQVLVTGPKTPPEPHIKFNIVNSKQQQLRTMSNPLLDSSLEQLEGDGDDEPNEIMHKGPNTPPEPPVPYDPFEPTKSRSPTPCEIIDAEQDPSPTPELNQRLSPQQLQSSKTPPKLPQHESPKTPSPLRHSPPKVADEGSDKLKQLPFQAATIDSDDDSGGGGGGGGAGGGGDSPYSPGSSEGDDLFEPPQPLNSNAGVAKPKTRLPLPTVNKYLPLPKVTAQSQKKRSGKAHKENSKKGSGKKEIGIKLDEDQLKILDELPNSAVEMQVKDKFLKKLNRQERVVEEVKLVLKPHYAKKHVSKEEYKEILRKSVPKICHSRSGEINPMKIQRLIEAYVKKYRHKAKKKGSGPAIPPLRQNKTKTLWC